MQGRSPTSPVHTWPDAVTVLAAARRWAERAAAERKTVVAIAALGSYARGDWGPGSDLDMVVILEGEIPPIGERARGWDTSAIPDPVDLLLYSRDEWTTLLERSPRMADVVRKEGIWLVGGPPAPAPGGPASP